MNLIVDTQVLSYRFKRKVNPSEDSESLAISSITANEFLIAQPKESESPDYYTIHPSIYPLFDGQRTGFNICDNIKNPKHQKALTDRVIIDFGCHFSPYIEFGNEAISEIINKNLVQIYKNSIAHLSKEKQKYLVKRLEYIIENGYHCYSLTKSSIEEALNLFSIFISQHNCKGNIRNTVNDILILSTAIARGKKLLTYDNLLSNFVAKYYGIALQKYQDRVLIDFSSKEFKNQTRKESKNYIHQGWSYILNNKDTKKIKFFN